MRNAREAVVLPIVLLVTTLALATFLFASAMLSVASRSASTQERNSTQALLAADSGLQTLRARASATPYSPDQGSFENWIESNFSLLDLGGEVEAHLEVVAESASSVTVESTGVTGSSQRVVLQEFQIVVGPPVAASANVPGALTSVDAIKSSSGATRVRGRANTEDAWTYVVELCTAHLGEYVEYDGAVHKVVSEPAADCSGTVDLEGLDGSTSTPPANTTVTHRPSAIAADMDRPTGDPPTSEILVTDATIPLFGVGSPITIGDGTSGRVTGVDGETLTIEWDDPPDFAVDEGTVVMKGIASGVTQGACNLNKDYTFPDGCHPDKDLTNLFYKTFGVSSPSLLYESLPDSQRLSGADLRDAGRTLSDVTWVTSPENNVRGQTGAGILIIENDPGQTITLNVDNSFTGLIYVIGNADIQGNAQYPGAIIVDGEADVTQVQGTADINFDPLVLMRALADIEFPNPNPGGLGEPVANTWRIR